MEPFCSHLKFQEPSSNELKNFNKGSVDFSVTGQKLNISSFRENALSLTINFAFVALAMAHKGLIQQTCRYTCR